MPDSEVADMVETAPSRHRSRNLEYRSWLSDESVSALQNLIQANLDSRESLRLAAARVSQEALAEAFRELAEERLDQAWELRALMARQAAGEIWQQGAPRVQIPLAWRNIRRQSPGETSNLLRILEREEESLRGHYLASLRLSGARVIRERLNEHYAAITAAHDQLANLRIALEAGSAFGDGTALEGEPHGRFDGR